MTSEEERDQFLDAFLPVLLRECMTSPPGGLGWCSTHDSPWLRRDHCDRYTDMDDFADSVLEAWQGRQP